MAFCTVGIMGMHQCLWEIPVQWNLTKFLLRLAQLWSCWSSWIAGIIDVSHQTWPWYIFNTITNNALVVFLVTYIILKCSVYP
jgi:hypothetical protein